jgi:hypothetical protein
VTLTSKEGVWSLRITYCLIIVNICAKDCQYPFINKKVMDRTLKKHFVCSFVRIFAASQHIIGHIVPNAIIGLQCYVMFCKWQ